MRAVLLTRTNAILEVLYTPIKNAANSYSAIVECRPEAALCVMITHNAALVIANAGEGRINRNSASIGTHTCMFP